MAIKYADVQKILQDAVGPDPSPSHSGNERFWLKPLAEFKALEFGDPNVKVVIPGDAANSGIIKALRGLTPFNEDPYPRMPQDLDPVSEDNIKLIEGWISAGCP
jgi:hypothetical protein